MSGTVTARDIWLLAVVPLLFSLQEPPRCGLPVSRDVLMCSNRDVPYSVNLCPTFMCPVNMMRCQVEARAGKRRQGIADGRDSHVVCLFCPEVQQNQAAAPNQRPMEPLKNQQKNQMWNGVLGITLVEGQDLPQYGQGDIYARFRLGDQKYKSKVGHFLKVSLFSLTLSFPHTALFYNACSLYFISFAYFPSSLPSRCLSVTHLHLGSLGHGRGSSLDWARLPLTSLLRFGCWASLPSFAYPACPVHLPVLVGLPPDDSMAHLSGVVALFLCKAPPLFSLLVCLSDKADSNWKLSVFTIPQWLPGCTHTSAQKKRHTHTHAHTHNTTSLSPLLPRSG